MHEVGDNSRVKVVVVLLLTCLSAAGSSVAVEPWDTFSDTWGCTDRLGRELPRQDEAGEPRDHRTVGLFYYIWHGSHGYDQHGDPSFEMQHGQGVAKPDAAKDIESPRDIQKILEAPLGQRPWGPKDAWHHWGESVFGYYVANDEWLIRRHARMFADAGIDVVIFDTTNGYHYRDTYMKILEIYADIRAHGGTTPQIAFNCGFIPENNQRVVEAVYRDLYSKELYKELWFMWKGKPLILANFEAVDQNYTDYFSMRYSWAWSKKGRRWFGDGKDRWPWVEEYPQAYGWHEDPDVPEQVVVATAEHPGHDVGKSFSGGKPAHPAKTPLGLYFSEQWKRALEVDPEFVLITQWNEWVAMRFDLPGRKMRGETLPDDHPQFIDVLDAEYNRDIEPMRGGFADNYYYQMIDGIRRYKGVRKHRNVFRDTVGDTEQRNHFGWGNTGRLQDGSGRNDIKEAKVSVQDGWIEFKVETVDPLTPPAGENWMELFIATGQNTPHWEGYQFRVRLDPFRKKNYILERSLGGWMWEGLAEMDYMVDGKVLSLKVPKTLLDLDRADVSFRFKWSDNRQTTDALDWLIHGDAAPNGRFQFLFEGGCE